MHQLALLLDLILDTAIVKRKEKFQFIKVKIFKEKIPNCSRFSCRFNRCEHIIDILVKCMSVFLLLISTLIPDWWVHSIIIFYFNNSQHSGKVLDLAFTSNALGNLSWNLNFMHFLTLTFPHFLLFFQNHIVTLRSNKEPSPSSFKQIFSEIIKMHCWFLKILFSTSNWPISTKLGTMHYYIKFLKGRYKGPDKEIWLFSCCHYCLLVKMLLS
jgi:hypothetical protein